MIVIGIDPGWQKSAYVMFNGTSISDHDIIDNEEMRVALGTWAGDYVLAIEQISMGGMVAGMEIFETCFWSGRFAERWFPRPLARIKRTSVKKHVCGQMRANDANIRAALIERFGPDLMTAIGKKSSPGPLFGIKSHEWAALAVAVTHFDTKGHEDPLRIIRPDVTAEF